MARYIKCSCCNQPIAVSDDDIGLTLNCSRTGQIVFVNASEIRSTEQTPKAPVVTPAKAATGSNPPAVGSNSPRPSPDKSPCAQTSPTLKPVAKASPLSTSAKSNGINRGLLVATCLSTLSLLIWVSFYFGKMSKPGKVSKSKPTEFSLPSAMNHKPPEQSPEIKKAQDNFTKAPQKVSEPPKPVIKRPDAAPNPTPDRVANVLETAPHPTLVIRVVPPPPDPVAVAPAPRDLGTVMQALIKTSKDPDAAIRAKAAFVLGTRLRRDNDEPRLRIAEALVEMGADAEPAHEALRDAVKDGDADVRRAARKALDKLDAAKSAKEREIILSLAKEIGAKEPAKRIKALDQIAAYGSKANIVGEQLIDAMMHTQPSGVREAAALALEKVNLEVYPHVFAMLRGEAKEQFAAIAALGTLGKKADITVQLLLKCHFQPSVLRLDPGARDRLDNFPVIAKIAPKDKRFAEKVLSEISTPPINDDGFNSRRRISGLEQLNVINASPDEKVKALSEALKHDHTVEVIRALQGLGKDAKAALPELMKLKDWDNEAIQKAAREAIEKIE